MLKEQFFQKETVKLVEQKETPPLGRKIAMMKKKTFPFLSTDKNSLL